MKTTRFFLFSSLLCLPTIAAIAALLWFSIARVPKLTKYEPVRVGLAYREIAEKLKDKPGSATYVGERPKGWWQHGKIDGLPWGYEENAAACQVWYEPEKGRCRAIRVDRIDEVDYVRIVWFGGGLIAVVLVALTVLLIWSFVRFVKERDELLTTTAHDLTTPLAGLQLLVGRDDDEAKTLVAQMMRQVENIKDFIRLGGHRPKPVREMFDLRSACLEAYALFREDFRDLLGGNDIEMNGEAMKLLVTADRTMTLQILWNLFSNELKYAAPFGRVWIRFGHEGDIVTVEFSDEGPGMTWWQRRRAFDCYYRAQAALGSGKGGFGIGLFTSRKFARMMGGDLTVRGNSPRGCVFKLKLTGASC